MAYVEPELWYQQLAACHAAASGLITDSDGRVLVVKPNYRDGWSLPGGMLESDERPEDGCARTLDFSSRWSPACPPIASAGIRTESPTVRLRPRR